MYKRWLLYLGLILVFRNNVWASDFKKSIRLPIEWGDLHFVYQDIEGNDFYFCKHEIENKLSQDWKVFCFDRKNVLQRSYGVHLFITLYEKYDGKMAIETLYWVTDRSEPRSRAYSSSSTWYEIAASVPLVHVSLAQSVENDQARLRVEIVPKIRF